jgi:hypothetical protein
MPAIASSRVPPPKSWDEFEAIALAAAKLRWNSSDFYRNGRQGQKQDGVDIWGRDDDGRLIGVQCKNTIGGVSLAVINTEIADAEVFTPKLARLYIATTAERDGVLQKEVRKISAGRAEKEQFRVDVLFWDDICQDLAKDDDIFFSHYPQFRNRTDPVIEHDKRLYDELTGLLNSDGVIGFVNRHNMAAPFQDAELDPLWEFCCSWNSPERKFITPDLEGAREALLQKAREYQVMIATETFAVDTPGWRSVPSEWEEDQPQRFARAIEALHRLAGEIVDLHANFIHVGP